MKYACFLLLASFCSSFVYSQTISTVAGIGISATNIPGFSGDGAAATLAEMNDPAGIAVDASGNIYVSDEYNYVVRKVDYSTGIISTYAGNKVATIAGFSSTSGYAYSGDGSSATLAELNRPMGLAIDGSGNLYIADEQNMSIRMVNTSHNISTIAGITPQNYGNANTWWVPPPIINAHNTPATSAYLYCPSDVAVDGYNNIFIADQEANQIVVVSAINGSINGITVQAGDIYVIAGITGAGNNPNNDAGPNGNSPYLGGYSGDGGPATAAELYWPRSVAVLGTDVYFSDTHNHIVRKIDNSGTITTVAGTIPTAAYGATHYGYSGDGGAATAAELYSPGGIAFDYIDNMYIADQVNNCIRKVNFYTHTITTVAGNNALGYGFYGDGGAPTSAELAFPIGIAFDQYGSTFYIADFYNSAIRWVH